MMSTRRVRAVCAALVAAWLTAGCGAMRPDRESPEPSGFLADYSQLTRNPEYPAAFVYMKPGVPWVKFTAIQLESVDLWLGDQTVSVSPADRQMLTDMLYTSLHDALVRHFTLVDQSGPDTLRLRVGLTQTSGANVALRTQTTVLPQVRLPGALVRLDASTAAAVGSARVEAEVLESATNELLAAAVDDRAGTEALYGRHSFKTWGDVEAACDYWSARVAWRLATGGVQVKPDAKMPEEPTQSRPL